MSSVAFYAGPGRNDRYLIRSWGNGWAYTVTDRDTGKSFFVQDEAASKLQEEAKDFQDMNILDEYMDVLGEAEEGAIL